MMLVREHINEKFTDDSDPIHDMRIGIYKLIEKWLEKYNISHYTINNDLTIDVNDHVTLSHMLTGNLPEYIQFGKITNGYFAVDGCGLTTLRGCPTYVDRGNTSYWGNFQCKNNQLTSLEFAPQYISGHFLCGGNAVKFTEKDVRKFCKFIGRTIDLT